MATLLLLRFLFVCSTAAVATESLPAVSPPVDNPKYILDPLNSTSYGRILSPERIILKLDCLGCPKYHSSWDTDATALIWDFTINGPSPQILLNNDKFYPPGKELGWTPITAHVALPVPSTTTIDSYIDAPNTYEKAGLYGLVRTFRVENEHGWNLTSIQFTTLQYGTTRRNLFKNDYWNVSMVQVFLLQTPHEERKDLRRGKRGMTVMDWTLEWWQVTPLSMLLEMHMQEDEKPETVPLPLGLKNKLLGIEEPDDEDREPVAGKGQSWGLSGNRWAIAAVALSITLIVNAAAVGICLAIIAALARATDGGVNSYTSGVREVEETRPLLDDEDSEAE